MDEIAKLFSKLEPHTRKELLETVDCIRDPLRRKTLQSVKLKGGNFFRVRKGRFRIIYHIEHGEAVVDSIRARNEKTYRGI